MPYIYFETYGCQMNIAEAESLRHQALQRGHRLAEQPEEADFVIINTCSVRETAEARIIGRLGYYRMLNKQRPLRVVLMGCMSENVGLEMQKRFADVVSIVWGTYAKEEVFNFLDDISAAQNHLGFGAAYSFMPSKPSKEAPFKAFLPVSHGCNKFCSYCIVPHVRGKEHNRPFEDILDNAKALQDEGVLEICLLGQTIDTYRHQGRRLPDLLEALAVKTSIPRITFLTAHPREFLIESAQLMASFPSILSYLHLPLQSGSDRILSLMKRGYTNALYREKIAQIREACPGIVLSTDIIVGFPSETDEDFTETLALFKDTRYHEGFLYRYNTRPHTPAEHFEGQVDENVKLRRLDELVHTHRGILAEQLSTHVGEESSVLFDRETKYSLKNSDAPKKQYLGRTQQNLVCAVESSENLIGQIRSVRIKAAKEALVEGILI